MGEETAPGVFAVKSGFDWQRLVSLQVDSSDSWELCAKVRSQMGTEQAAAWCRGDFGEVSDDLTAATSPALELWEELAAEPLSWFDASELDYLRRALAEIAVP